MKKLTILLLAVILLTACGQTNGKEQEAMYVNITAQEAKTIMDTEQGYVILDTRTREEYDQGHIPGAIQISHDEIMEKAIATGIGIVGPQRIDEINILQATYEAMREAISKLEVKPDILLNDAKSPAFVYLPSAVLRIKSEPTLSL